MAVVQHGVRHEEEHRFLSDWIGEHLLISPILIHHDYLPIGLEGLIIQDILILETEHARGVHDTPVVGAYCMCIIRPTACQHPNIGATRVHGVYIVLGRAHLAGK